ncbi:MAG: TadE family protein [Limnobacter sp.]|nr:TadE family protein [Limnobacter sp.]
MKTIRLGYRKNRGVQLIELAIVLPVLLIIIFGLIEYSVLFGAQLSMNSTASEAARRAMAYRAGQNTQFYVRQAEQAVETALPDYIGEFKGRVISQVTAFDCGDATCIRVNLTYPNYASNPLIGSFPLIPLPASLSAEAVSRVEPDVL